MVSRPTRILPVEPAMYVRVPIDDLERKSWKTEGGVGPVHKNGFLSMHEAKLHESLCSQLWLPIDIHCLVPFSATRHQVTYRYIT
jgi:hypothetical protein